MTVHEHAQQTLSAWLDGQVDPDLGVIAGGGAEAGMHSLQGSLLSMRLYNRERHVPDFLPVPARTAKPRSVGLTHVLDKGAAPDDVRRLVDRAGHLIDI